MRNTKEILGAMGMIVRAKCDGHNYVVAGAFYDFDDMEWVYLLDDLEMKDVGLWNVPVRRLRQEFREEGRVNVLLA